MSLDVEQQLCAVNVSLRAPVGFVGKWSLKTYLLLMCYGDIWELKDWFRHFYSFKDSLCFYDGVKPPHSSPYVCILSVTCLCPPNWADSSHVLPCGFNVGKSLLRPNLAVINYFP